MPKSRPITDSSLAVPPQYWRDGGRSQQEWVEAIDKFRTVRGNIIADGYDIESALGRLITEVFYPTIPWDSSHDAEVYQSHCELRSIFTETFIDPSRFADKIRIFKSAMKEVDALRSACPPDLLRHLNELQDTRNRFAHNPIRFEFTDPPESKLKAMLVCRDRSEEISSDYILAKWELANECSSALHRLIRILEARFDKFQHTQRDQLRS